MHATQPRTSDRFVATTRHLTEWNLNMATHDFSEYVGDNINLPLEAIDALDTAIVISIRPRVQPADFTQDDF